MKKIIFVILILLSSCQSWSENKSFASELNTYGLKGNVKSYTEKSIKVKFDKNWSFIEDTVKSYSMKTERYFNEDGFLDSIYYTGKNVTGTKVIYDNLDKNRRSSFQYDLNGNEISFTRCVSFKDSILEVETINSKTNITTSISWTKYENKQVAWQKSKLIENDLETKNEHIRDNKGLELAIRRTFSFGSNKKQEAKILIKYIEFDKYGNWTKRIEYSDESQGILITREFIYEERK